MSLVELRRQRDPVDAQKLQDELTTWIRQLYVELEVRAETPHVLLKPEPDAAAGSTGAIAAIKLPHDVRVTRVCILAHDVLTANATNYAEILLTVIRGDGALGPFVAQCKTNVTGLAFATERNLDLNADNVNIRGGQWLLAYTGKFGAGVVIPALSLVVWTKRI